MQTAYHLSAEIPDSLPGTILASLIAAGEQRHFSDGQMVQQQGDYGNGFWIILSGEVHVGRLDSGGGMTTFTVLQPGQIFGELAYFADVKRQADAFARGPAELVWVGDHVIRCSIDRSPDVALVLLRSLARQLQTALQLIDDRRRLTVPARLAQLLLDQTKADEADQPVLKATQQELADWLGVSRVSVVTTLTKFARSGLVRRGYGKVYIADSNGLRQMTMENDD